MCGSTKLHWSPSLVPVPKGKYYWNKLFNCCDFRRNKLLKTCSAEIFSKFTSNIWDNEKIHKNKKEGHY